MRIESSTTNYANFYYKKQIETEKVQVIDEVNQKQIKHNKEEKNEELIALYYNHQATQLMKDRVNTIFDSPEEDTKTENLDYEDIRDLKKLDNRSNLLNYYEENYAKTQEKKELEVWA